MRDYEEVAYPILVSRDAHQKLCILVRLVLFRIFDRFPGEPLGGPLTETLGELQDRLDHLEQLDWPIDALAFEPTSSKFDPRFGSRRRR